VLLHSYVAAGVQSFSQQERLYLVLHQPFALPNEPVERQRFWRGLLHSCAVSWVQKLSESTLEDERAGIWFDPISQVPRLQLQYC
jgi:hypothetical protein